MTTSHGLNWALQAEVVQLLGSRQQLEEPWPECPDRDADENPRQHRESDFESFHAPSFPLARRRIERQREMDLQCQPRHSLKNSQPAQCRPGDGT